MSFLKKLFSKTPETDIDKSETVSPFYLHKDKIYPWVKVLFSKDEPAQIKLTEEDSPIYKKTRLSDQIRASRHLCCLKRLLIFTFIAIYQR